MTPTRRILPLLLIVLLLPVSFQISSVGAALAGNSSSGWLSELDGLPEEARTEAAAAPALPSYAGKGVWVPFISGAVLGKQSDILPKSRDTMGLCVDSDFYGMFKLTQAINQTIYHYLNVPAAGQAVEVGKPAVPVMTRYLEVPLGVNLNVEILYQTSQVLDGYMVMPAQHPIADMPNATEPPFEIDNVAYSTNTFFPASIAWLEGADASNPIILRGHRLVALSLAPVQFNPVTQQVKTYAKIEVRLNHDRPAQVGAIPERLASPAFDALCAAFIPNYRYAHPDTSVLLTEHVRDSIPMQTGGEYLIITHDDFLQQAQQLANWKTKKGVLTRVVRTSDIKAGGPTAAEIRTYVQVAYDTWHPAPTYLLLVGDSEFIPVHYDYAHPDGEHGGFGIGSDLPYATLDGDDYFPDIYVGRLSVDTPAQATTVVNKILDYERNPPAAADFYSHVLASAYFQDDIRDGYEDRRFVLTAEEIRDYLTSQGYTVERVYCTEPEVTPTNYNDWIFDNGDPLPADLLRPSFAWDGDTMNLTNGINAGRFLVYHRDHGDSTNFWNHFGSRWGEIDGWNDPSFTVGDIPGLVNGAQLPVVFSIECMSGWFDGEIDQTNDSALTHNAESICEELVRRVNGGAVAAIGAARISESGYNDELIKGFIGAIWPGFDPASAPSELFSLGQVLTYGKVYMAQAYEYGGTYTKTTFYLFHLFGDPEMPIWTAQPGALTVTHPTTIGSGGLQKLFVKVQDALGAPVHYARVCLQKVNEVYAVAYTDTAGCAYFAVTPSTGGSLDITVTKHNYRPYESTIAVTSGGAILSVTPALGPSSITVTLTGTGFVGTETVAIYFGGSTPDTTVPAVAGSFTRSLAVPAGAEGPLNVIGVGQTSTRTGITLFRRLPNQPLPDPYLYCQWDPSTWHLNPAGEDPRWDSPDIQLVEKSSGTSVASDDLVAGVTYTIRATIHNDATVDASDTEVTFQWAAWGAGQGTWTPIDTDRITVPGDLTATAEANWTPSATGHVCLLVTLHHPYDSNLNNNLGQENTHVQPVSSPGAFTFSIWNPTSGSALVYLELRQVMGGSIWSARLKRDYPQVQAPGEDRTVTVIVTAPSTAQQGETHRFTVTAYINGTLIGGIEADVVVQRATATLPPIVIILGGGVLLIAVVAIVVVLRRRKP